MLRWLGLVALGACGRVGFETLVDASIATTGDAAMLTYRDAVLADAPLGYWRLGDAGPNVHDEMGSFDSAFVGPCPPSTGALTGDSNGATQFAGTCRVPLGSSFRFEGTAAFAVEVWIDSLPSAMQTQYVAMSETRTADDNPIDGYAIVIDASGIYGERGVGGTTSVAFGSAPPAGFYHVVYNYDGTESQLFVDAVGGATVADARVMPTYNAALHLGGVPGFFPADAELGALDEVAVYDHALSQARITLHHDLGILGPRPL